MKISSLHIIAFGGLKDLSLKFNDHFNVIYGENENGKSTIMAFIKMMFYGSDRGSAQISKNIRKKYSPWDGSPMAGSIDFEHNGKHYRLEREFRTGNATDKIVLCDMDFGTRQGVPSDVGMKFFGLTSQAFERSVFIGQFGASDSDVKAEGEINSKLSNIVMTGDEDISYQTVYSRIEKSKLALMSKSGRAGSYDKNIKAIAELEEKLEKAELENEEALHLLEKAEDTEGTITLLEQKSAQLKSILDREDDIKNAKKLTEMLELKAKLDKLNKNLTMSDGKIVDDLFVKKIMFGITKTEQLEEKLKMKLKEAKSLEKNISLAANPTTEANPGKEEEYKHMLEILHKQKADLQDELESKAQEYKNVQIKYMHSKNAKKRFSRPLLTTAAVFLVLGALLFIIQLTMFGAISLSAGVVFAILAFVIRPADKELRANLENKMLALKSAYSDLKTKEANFTGKEAELKARLENINTVRTSNSAVVDNQKSDLKECYAELESLEHDYKAEKTALLELFKPYKQVSTVKEINNMLNGIDEQAQAQKELKQQLNYIVRDVGNISYTEAEAKLKSIMKDKVTSYNFEEIKRDYEDLSSKITDNKTLLAAINAEAKKGNDPSREIDSLNNQLKQLKSSAEAQKEYCDAADLAMEVLTDSFAEIRRSYGSVLEHKASEIFNGLTGEAYKTMSISKSFDISVEKNGVFGGKEIDYLSDGTQDQAYLSLRLALSELISSTGENLPVLLDDALAQYDDTRTKTAVEFLNEYAKDEQIIMFTCHNAIADVSKGVGADLQKINS